MSATTTTTEVQQLRAALEAHPKGPGRRIPPELRQRIARYACRRAGEGAARATVAREIGVGEQTIVRSLNASPGALLPVRVSESSSAVIVRGPAGLTIEGLDIAGLAELIRTLS